MAGSLPTPPETADEKRWWIAIRQVAQGPFDATYIITAMKRGLIQRTALACPVGSQRWRPVSDCPEFAEIAVPPPLPPVLRNPDARQPLLTNPTLPTMSNLISVYCIAITPILWAFNNLSGMTYFDFGVLGPLVSTAVTALLIVGGLRFRALRPSGLTIIKTAFGIDMVIFGLSMLMVLLSTAFSTNTGVAPSQAQNPIPEISPVTVLARLIGLGAYSFELIGLVWLHRQGRFVRKTVENFTLAETRQIAVAAESTGNDAFGKNEPQIRPPGVGLPPENRKPLHEDLERENTLPIGGIRDASSRDGSRPRNSGHGTGMSVLGFVIFWIVVLGCLNPLSKRLTDWLHSQNELDRMLQKMQAEQRSSPTGKQ
jgi:GYF domain 2